MKKLPTADDIYLKHNIHRSNHSTEDAMIEFAKSCVKFALEQQVNKINSSMCYYEESSENAYNEVAQAILNFDYSQIK